MAAVPQNINAGAGLQNQEAELLAQNKRRFQDFLDR